MVLYGLQATLQEIVIGDNLTQDIDGLVAWAEKQGRLKDLVAAALSQKPGNPKLQALTQNGSSLEEWDALDTLYTTTPPCPYPGMVPFEEKDAPFFYGREKEIGELLARLQNERNEHFQLVVGPSGSGKSSLLASGVLPKLSTSSYWSPNYWHVISMRPGEHPNEELEKQLSGAPTAATVEARLNVSGAQRLLLVVDQLEELFAQANQLDQNAFIASIKNLCSLERVFVVAVMRADFYPDLMVSGLWDLAKKRRLEVVLLPRDKLRSAIVEPAASEGVAVELEPALVERLLNDAADEPGSLPMLQQTLRWLWPKMERRKLTLAAYDAMGQGGRSGLSVAIARIADATFAALEKEQQVIARRVFLHLVQFGEGRPDTRRQRSKAELRSQEDDPVLFDGTLTALVNSRLIVVGGAKEQGTEGTVDIAHDTLIRNWPTLQDWIAQSKVAVQTRDWLEEKAAEWKKFDYKSGLLDPGELVEAERWLASPASKTVGYSKLLSGLVSESRRQERLNAKRRIAIIVGLTLLALSTSIAASFAFNLNAIATSRLGDTLNAQATSTVRLGETLDAKSTAVAERDEAERLARLAHVGQLNTQSRAVLDHLPQQSLLLAIEALTTTMRAGKPAEPRAEETLRLALTQVGGLGIAQYEGSVRAIAISPDSRWLAIAGTDHEVHLRDLANLAAPPINLTSLQRYVGNLTFSPDGGWLLASGTGSAKLWDLTIPSRPSFELDPLDSNLQVSLAYGRDDMVFSPDSRWLALGTTNSQALFLWDLAKRNAPQRKVLTHRKWDYFPNKYPATFSTDSHWLLVYENTTTLWNLDNLDSSPVPEFEEENGPFDVLGLSEDRRWLATSANDNNILVWDLAQLNSAYKPRSVARPDNTTLLLTISSNGQWLVNIGEGAATVVDLSSSDPQSSVRSLLQWSPQVGRIHEATMSLDSRWLITTANIGSRSVLNLTTLYGKTYSYDLNNVSPPVVSSDSRWLACLTGNVAKLWDLSELNGVEQLQANLPVVLRGHDALVTSAAFSQNGRWLVTTGIDGSVRLWELDKDQSLLIPGEDPQPPNRLDTTLLNTAAQPRVLPATGDYPISIAATSSDGRWLAAGDYAGQVSIWDLTAPDVAASRRGVALQDTGYMLAISCDQRWLFTSGVGGPYPKLVYGAALPLTAREQNHAVTVEGSNL